jgi:hypothetical protein
MSVPHRLTLPNTVRHPGRVTTLKGRERMIESA